MKNGTLITICNHETGTSCRVSIPQHGRISKPVRRRIVSHLRTPPGHPGAGPLGEVGPQEPPETPGWRYTFDALPDGSVKATPQPIGKAVRK